MPILLLLAIPFAEIFLFLYVGSNYGWASLFLWTVITFIIGKRLMARQSVFQPMAGTAAPQKPMDQIILALGGFLLMVPGLLTDALGLLLIFPPTRFFLARIFKSRIEKMMASGQFKVMNFGKGFEGGFSGGFPGTGFPKSEPQAPHPPRQDSFSDDNMVIDADYKTIK